MRKKEGWRVDGRVDGGKEGGREEQRRLEVTSEQQSPFRVP